MEKHHGKWTYTPSGSSWTERGAPASLPFGCARCRGGNSVPEVSDAPAPEPMGGAVPRPGVPEGAAGRAAEFVVEKNVRITLEFGRAFRCRAK